ncbi:MAG: 4a-hydroxytetrahydrobiopterin dehydratase [Acidimicrobiales bacterium]
MTRPALVERAQLAEWLSRHSAWSIVNGHLVRELTTPDYQSGAALVHDQVALAEGLDHHPILTLGYRELRVELWTHDREGITRLDLEYAEAFDELVEHALGER